MGNTITIQIQDAPGGDLRVVQDPQKCSLETDEQVQWSSKDFNDWRVIFAPDAPLYPKVASPSQAALKLRAKRAEDLKHVKYVVVGLTKEGRLKHVDPELIIDE